VTLGRRNILAAIALALPAAFIVFAVANALERRDRTALLERIAQAQINDVTRDACQNDPMWFLAGPRTGRPKAEDRLMPDADVHLPRPNNAELPFEYFAYDEEFSPKSVAGPARFPDDMKRRFRAMGAPKMLTSTYASETGTGLQTAIATGWTPGPCAYLLLRQQPAPGVTLTMAMLLGSAFVVVFLVAWAAAAPTAARIRRLSLESKRSSSQNYAEMVKVSGDDEISALAAGFNDTAADIKRKAVDAVDRETALRRYVETTTEDVVPPMQVLEERLSRMAASGAEPALRQAVRETHRLMMQLQNLAAVTALRGVNDATPRETVDLAAVVQRLVANRKALADTAGVRIDAKSLDAVSVQAQTALIEQAVANLLDNAIIYNRQGGNVRIALSGYDHGRRFKLVIADDGPGVTEEQLAGLTANKRFRGDESRSRRPDSRGLGLALAREIADRFGLQLDLRQPSAGGFEAELTTRS
jgi:signal transduction histidine kinase